MNELQSLVDSLALEIERPVGIDDRQFRALAYSSHGEDVDPVRRASILRRQAPVEVTTWLDSLGLVDADGPAHVPARPDLGMSARVCLAIRFQGTVLGFLWLIDEPDALADEQLATSVRYAGDIGNELYRERLLELDQRAHERDAVLGLLAGSDGGGALTTAPAYLAVELRARHQHEPAGEAIEVRIAAGLEHLRRRLPPHTLIGRVEGTALTAFLATDDLAPGAARAAALRDAVVTHLGDHEGWTVVAGVGPAVTRPGDLRAAAGQAQTAARLVERIPELGPVACWERLGAFRPIAALLGDRPPLAAVPGPLRALLAAPDGAALVDTLMTYLDLGGDARAAAEALFVHRSSLYGRLHRIEAVTGLDLHSGDARLELHLGLRLWRMGGAPDVLPEG